MDNEPMKLDVAEKDGGYLIKLNETELCYVEHYSIDQVSPGLANLTVKMLVQYP